MEHNGGYHQCILNTTLDMSRFERIAETSKLRPIDGDGGETTPLAWERGVHEGQYCIPPQGQCGGFFFEPSKGVICCPTSDESNNDDAYRSSTRCVNKNDWYATCEKCVSTWQQCGGIEYTGGGCCQDSRDECRKIDEYFSQCQPALYF